MLANGTVAGNVHPENKGVIYFLGQILQKRLVAAMWVRAMRSPGPLHQIARTHVDADARSSPRK